MALFAPTKLLNVWVALDFKLNTQSGVIGKSTKFGFEWKWPLMGQK
jgi:hypothetical protein